MTTRMVYNVPLGTGDVAVLEHRDAFGATYWSTELRLGAHVLHDGMAFFKSAAAYTHAHQQAALIEEAAPRALLDQAKNLLDRAAAVAPKWRNTCK